MSRIAYVNGRFVRHSDAMISIDDRGLQFADSIYEVWLVINGRLVDAQGHWARAQRSLDGLGISGVSLRAVETAICETIRRNHVRTGFVYLQITRGTARRDHAFPKAAAPNIIITAKPFNLTKANIRAEKGIAAITVPDIRWARRDLKTTNLLPNVLARQAAIDAKTEEAIFVDDAGYVTEGASTNVWIIRDGQIQTRALSQAILPGVTRFTIAAIAADLGFSVLEAAFTVEMMLQADEVFITSATSLVTPIVEIDGKSIKTGRPGPISMQLRQRYLSAAQ
jgi:D-alanine transaminase